MIIDFEHHIRMEEQADKGSNRSGSICERYWDTDGRLRIRVSKEGSNVERHLQFMDEAGIDMAVLTEGNFSGLEQMRRWNDFCAKIVCENPRRFVGFASIPPLGGRPALEELDRAINGLGLKGVHILTRSEGRALDSKELWPFYEKVSELEIPIDVHVTGAPSGFDALHAPYALFYTMARELDMCTATLRVCLGGVLEDFPDLVFIMNHFGGGVSSVMERIDAYMNFVGPGWPSFYLEKPLISRPWREYFNKLYFNMSGREVGIGATKCALTSISPTRLLFGTDWPYNYDRGPEDVKRYIEGIKGLDLSPGSVEAMLGGNAAKLLGV